MDFIMFKKIITLLMSALFITGSFCGCDNSGQKVDLHGVSTDDELPEAAKEVEVSLPYDPENYDLTKERIALSNWTDAGFHSYLTLFDNGVLRIDKGGQSQSYADYKDYEATFNKFINMDIIFACQSELKVINNVNKLSSTGYILFRGAKLSDLKKNNPCYFIEYEDNGRFGMRLGKNGSDGQTYLTDKIELEADYKPYDFNNLKVGFFNEDGKVRAVVYFNGKCIINTVDEDPTAENLQAGHLFFQNGDNTIYLRGTDDDKATMPGIHPAKASMVGTIQTYDISKMKDTDYSFRDLITVMKARTYTDENGAVVPYRLYLPTNYKKRKKYPLMIYLHGAGLMGNDNLYQLAGDRDFYKAFLDVQETEEMILVVPQCSYNTWNGNDYNIHLAVGYKDFEYHVKLDEETEVAAAVKHLLDDLSEEFSVDRSRRYISGASMGGMGAYGLLARYPDYFAAGIIGCARGDLDLGERYAKTPLWIGHGDLDTAINVELGRATADAIKEAGGVVNYNEYPGRYHAFTTRAELLEAAKWALQFKKKQ